MLVRPSQGFGELSYMRSRLHTSSRTILLLLTGFVLPAEFGKFIADETEKWGKVVRAANIRAD